MRSERPLIASVLFLATGLSLILGYCNGASSFNASLPLAASLIHLDITTAGPAALGGVGLTAIGLVLLVWAFLAAIVSQASTPFRRAPVDRRVVPSERIFE